MSAGVEVTQVDRAADAGDATLAWWGICDPGDHDPFYYPRLDLGHRRSRQAVLVHAAAANDDLIETTQHGDGQKRTRLLACPICGYRFASGERRPDHIEGRGGHAGHAPEDFGLAPLRADGGDQRR